MKPNPGGHGALCLSLVTLLQNGFQSGAERGIAAEDNDRLDSGFRRNDDRRSFAESERDALEGCSADGDKELQRTFNLRVGRAVPDTVFMASANA